MVLRLNPDSGVLDLVGATGAAGGTTDLTGDTGGKVTGGVGENIDLKGLSTQAYVQTIGTPGSNLMEIKIIEPAVDGELLIGHTANGSPSVATLTAGTGISVVNGAGTVTIAATGALALTQPTDSGTATSVAGSLTLAGGIGITTSGAGQTSTVTSTTAPAWNGAIVETAAVSAASDGATITFSVEQSGGGDLTVLFSSGAYAWDTTPADTVALTAGSDVSPTLNYVYLLESTLTLTASTVGWPAAEHAPLATILCQSAASYQTDGAYKFHAWIDHVTQTSDQGHISDINFWIRQQNATYVSGVAQTLTITPNVGTPDDVIFTTTAGVVLQLHDHTFPAFAGTPDLYVVNDSVTAFDKITDLNALLTDSAGVSMSGKYFSLVIWGVVSEDTGDCKLMVNLPAGSYNTQSEVENDFGEYTNYNIPGDFTGTGFLISQLTLRHQAASGGTWTSIDEIDLRGLIPSLNARGSSTVPTEFPDNTFRIFDNADSTAKISFTADAISTATVRDIAMPDQDIDLTPTTGSFQASDADLTAISALATTGIAVRSAADTWTLRTITGGDGVSVTNGDGVAGNPTIAVTGGGFPWTVVTTGTQALAIDNGYIGNNGTNITYTLPTTAAVGSTIKILNYGVGLPVIAQNASEYINFVDDVTTIGVGGSLTGTNQYGSIELINVVADTGWAVASVTGNWTIL